MANVFRWYINRKYLSQKMEKKKISYVEVTISPENEDYSNPLHTKELREIAKLKKEGSMWWKKGEENQLEGWVRENTLLDALRMKNVFSLSKCELKYKEREIKEDMVFLQFSHDEKDLADKWKKLKEQVRFPKLDELVQIDKSQWIDFTPQARNMAKAQYKRVLGAKKETLDEKE